MDKLLNSLIELIDNYKIPIDSNLNYNIDDFSYIVINKNLIFSSNNGMFISIQKKKKPINTKYVNIEIKNGSECLTINVENNMYNVKYGNNQELKISAIDFHEINIYNLVFGGKLTPTFDMASVVKLVKKAVSFLS